MSTDSTLQRWLERIETHHSGQKEFRQAAEEVLRSILPLWKDRSDWQDRAVVERLLEPDRLIRFRVTWRDDGGGVRVNRAWRVQWSNALGPYKGGLRFHPTVSPSVLNFLAFEQTFKNSLTGLPLGGAKGGSDFDPHGASEREIERFCRALMTELHRHIGEDVDVPAGDIGVGAREIGFLFGAYTAIRNRWAGVLTGKSVGYGGSAMRTEATGWGAVLFLCHMLDQHGTDLEGREVAISGAGNVALYAAQKAIEMGATVVSLSDSNGAIHAPDGLDLERWEAVRALKEDEGGRLSALEGRWSDVSYVDGATPWGFPCDVALPCATQNELDADAARALVQGGLHAVTEGANMPCTAGAVAVFREAGVLLAPGKAANAGGVAVSGLEMSQNAGRLSWEREQVTEKLEDLMQDIHDRCVEHGGDGDRIDYIRGANRAGFIRVADALAAYGAG